MTLRQQHLFLAELALSGNVSFACRAADVCLADAVASRTAFPGFEDQWRRAQAEARTRFAQRASAAQPE